MKYYLLIISVFFSSLAFPQNFRIFKGPTNNTGTMLVLLQEQGSNAYYYSVTLTDYYADMKEMSKSDWIEYMREDKPNAEYLRKNSSNKFVGTHRDGITWNLEFSFDKYDKTAKLILSHSGYESNVFSFVEVGLDGNQLKKEKRPESSKGNCWVCKGKGVSPINNMALCTNCGGTGVVDFSAGYTDPNSNNQGGYPSDGNVGGSTTRQERNHEQEKRDVLNRTYGEKCRACGGSGKCRACNGTKVARSFGNTYECTCRNGNCGACNGTGKTSWNR